MVPEHTRLLKKMELIYFLGDIDFVKYIKANKYELIVRTDSITDPKSSNKT